MSPSEAQLLQHSTADSRSQGFAVFAVLRYYSTRGGCQ